MGAEKDRLDSEEDPVPQEENTDEDEEIQLINLYRFVYTQPDALLGVIMSLFDALAEKELLSDEEINEVMRQGIDRWKNRE